MGIEKRLRRLEAQRGPKLCEERYCMWAPTFVEVIRYPDGSEELVGSASRPRCPPSLCLTCPYRDGREPRRIRVVEVHRHLLADPS